MMLLSFLLNMSLGNIEDFTTLMNEKAEELGCKNTHFVNPNGEQDESHYSTAYDLSLIAKYAMQNETFRKIVQTTSYQLPATDKYPKDDSRHCMAKEELSKL